MKRTSTKITLFALFTATALIFAACDNGSGGGSNKDKDSPDSIEELTSGQREGREIKLADAVIGYASLGTSYTVSGESTTVTTKNELITAISNGGIIIVDGMIDISEGMLPSKGSTSLTSTTALDNFVKSTKSAYANYADWVAKYTGACSETTEDGDETAPSGAAHSSLYSDLWALNKAYGDKIQLTLKSNTTLIGKSANCGIRGGSIQLKGVENIIIRNLTIQDAYDPFPHHEVATENNAYKKSDGYNAQWDGINIQNGSNSSTCKNIWIDHCTFEDTIDLAYTTLTTEEKWQTYDGLCDMKNDTTNVTVSYCIFRNHDKTMLIGSGDSDGDNTKRFVTLYHNYFYNCGQRLPMVRNTTIHIYNNYYEASTPHYEQQYAVGVRKNAIIYAENNYFGSGIKYAFKDDYGTLHSSGNTDKAQKTSTATVVDTTLFSTLNKYTYTAMPVATVPSTVISEAGAGCTLAQ